MSEFCYKADKAGEDSELHDVSWAMLAGTGILTLVKLASYSLCLPELNGKMKNTGFTEGLASLSPGRPRTSIYNMDFTSFKGDTTSISCTVMYLVP
jgi:hypothetical protein